MNLRSYVFNDDGIALVSERPIPDGSTALELSAFKNVYHKAISVIWILLDEQIQNQVRQSKSGPVLLWTELSNRFAAISADCEISRASATLHRISLIPLSEVNRFMAGVFAAHSTLARHGLQYPVASLVNLFRQTLPKEQFRVTLESIRVSNDLASQGLVTK